VRIREKLTALEARKDATWTAPKALHDRMRELRGERDRKKGAQHELSGVLSGTRRQAPAPDDPRQQEIAWLTDELGRLEARYAEAQAHQTASGRIYDAVAAYLERSDIATIRPIVVDRVRADSLASEVASIRANLAELAQEEQAVTHAPLPLSEALERLDQELRPSGRRVEAECRQLLLADRAADWRLSDAADSRPRETLPRGRRCRLRRADAA
jgi:chromosome segregation ATPase